MSISSIFILDGNGKSLICQDYRGDIENLPIKKFYKIIMKHERSCNFTPIVEYHDISYLFVKHNNLYFVAVANRNVNAAIVMSFIHQFIQILGEYFGHVAEESIRDNFVLIYEILDEIMDFGYPQFTESKILKSYIFQSGQKLEINKPPPAVTNAVSWRKEGIYYRKNEVFLDVIEKVSLLVNSSGSILSLHICGTVLVKSNLSGMPEVKIGFNDSISIQKNNTIRKIVQFDDIKFHQCVKLATFELEKNISFIPPDGNFELMNYRMTSTAKMPFWIESDIHIYPGTKMDLNITLKSQFGSKFFATFVDVIIPAPTNASSPSCSCSTGVCRYFPEQNSIIWSIKSFPGQKEAILKGHLLLPVITSDNSQTAKPTISVKFEVPSLVLSNIKVDYLKVVDKSGYRSLPWVRYILKEGVYEFRTN